MSATRPSPALVRALLNTGGSKPTDAEMSAWLDFLESDPDVDPDLGSALAAHIQAVAEEMRRHADDREFQHDHTAATYLRVFARRLEGKETK
jgi:hypothetical protein